MAQNDKYKVTKKTTSGRTTKKPASSAGTKSNNPAQKGKKETASSRSLPKKKPSAMRQIAPYITFVAGLLLAICIYLRDYSGTVGEFIGRACCGLFSYSALIIPVVFFVFAFTSSKNRENIPSRITCSVISVTLISSLAHIFTGKNHTFSISEHYRDGAALSGGGVLGGLTGELLWRALRVCAPVLIIAVLIVLLPMSAGITPRSVYIYIRYKIKLAAEARIVAKTSFAENKRLREEAEKERYREKKIAARSKGDFIIPDEPLELDEAVKIQEDKPKKPFDANLPLEDTPEDDGGLVDPKIFDSILSEMNKEKPDAAPEESPLSMSGDIEKALSALETVEAEAAPEKIPLSGEENTDPDELDLEKIFVNPEDAELLLRLNEAYGLSSEDKEGDTQLIIEREAVSSPEGQTDGADHGGTKSPADTSVQASSDLPPEKAAPVYNFPPLSLLAEDELKKDENIREELQENAVKLVETLRSFNVKTKIVNVSRGATVTRYELLPESGTRVRSIANLVDDIALNLATTGVRIEAPIPGKSAVGIEVPNKNKAIVHLRGLLEGNEFKGAKSYLTTGLGENVAGESVYLDVAKMPHLLIAGATGSGKSVCINSLIISLLYKASPENVKLILIDPKKVELNVYNGLPHLLVPVVSDPKKAAGSLSWAVNEMERRFGLIEEVGVRNLAAYNEITRDDPAKEYMPQIVIVIDELADLMMTAPDDVEESICRLAQKARAAGMHLIIGTQRPSVDVITGLIKSNIPSRIAFTVASQVDSRTIIDRGGAENLIGYGDMLYNPVGAPKPIRVQGAFVSDSEVEKVVTYIKEANTATEYNDKVMEEIEDAASRCGNKKGSASSASQDAAQGEDDPMLRAALELAVESRKISTSLIQRRLSLGYGRAAKLIDRMEQLGYVSAPDGQKPREVLISKQDFMEMVLRDEQ